VHEHEREYARDGERDPWRAPPESERRAGRGANQQLRHVRVAAVDEANVAVADRIRILRAE
jgi:hypothetical protein